MTTTETGENPVTALLGDALEPLKAKREELAAQATLAKTAYDDLISSVRTIDKVLRAGGLLESKPSNGSAKPTRRKRSSGKEWAVSEAMLIRARETLPYLSPDGFTIKQLATEMDVAGATAKAAVETLKDHGEVVFLGARQTPTSGGNKAFHWKVVSH